MNVKLFFTVLETMVGSAMDVTAVDEEREQSPQASTDK